MVIVAKIGEDEMYTPHVTIETGIFKKKREQTQDFKNLEEVINHIQEQYGDRYRGLFDLFEFEINGEVYPFWSKCTYEEIFSLSQVGKNGNTYVFDEKDEGTWEWRKRTRTSSLSAAIYTNSENSESKLRVGQKDPELDAKLSYDVVLYGLVNVGQFLQVNDQKKFIELFSLTKELLDKAKKTHNISDWGDFDPVLEYFESFVN